MGPGGELTKGWVTFKKNLVLPKPVECIIDYDYLYGIVFGCKFGFSERLLITLSLKPLYTLHSYFDTVYENKNLHIYIR